MAFNLEQLPRGAVVCADANILAFHFVEHEHLSAASRAFLARSVRKEIRVFTPVIAASDATHRVMISEAGRRLGLTSSPKILRYLKKHPQLVRQLRENLDVVGKLHKLGVDILPVTYRDLHNSKWIRRKFGLLTNDSIIVAMMRSRRIVHLATNDRDFQRVKGIKVWMP